MVGGDDDHGILLIFMEVVKKKLKINFFIGWGLISYGLHPNFPNIIGWERLFLLLLNSSGTLMTCGCNSVDEWVLIITHKVLGSIPSTKKVGKKSTNHKCGDVFLDSPFYSVIRVHASPYCFQYSCFVISFKIGKRGLSNLFFLKILSALLSSLNPHMNFNISLSIYGKMD